MKLFRKIFLQVFAGCILLTMVPLLYFLHESERQSLTSVYLYERKSMRQAYCQFRETLESACHGENEQTIWDVVAIQEFKSLIGSNGALYREGEELYNVSPYEFDVKGVQDIVKKTGYAVEGTAKESGIGFRDCIQQAGESKLMLLVEEWGEVNIPSYFIIYYKDVTYIYNQTKILFLKGTCLAAALLAMTGVLLYLGIYWSIRPLTELKQAASAIAEGAYGNRARVRGKDEIGELAVSFNQMAQKVEEHVEELSDINYKQTQLIGSLAHELKTPLTAIIGYSDTMLAVPLSEKRKIQALHYIQSEGQRLARLSAKMMELTGLYREELSISIKKVNGEEFLQRIKALTAYRLKEKNICLVVTCTPKDLTFQADEDLLTSLLLNLIDNAYKASKPESTITISADSSGISVKDHGKGIPSSELKRVTEAFYMVDKSRSRTPGSVGLGLTFCKQIAELHGADLILESEEGKGTRVKMRYKTVTH